MTASICPRPRAEAAYLDDDTVLFTTAKDGETTSGYARIVKQWRRGTACEAKTLYEGETSDVASAPATFHTKQGNTGLVVRAVSFFESDYFVLEKDGVRKLAMPRSADVKGLFNGAWIATLRQTL